jgi:predicted glycogen debranching enzyme
MSSPSADLAATSAIDPQTPIDDATEWLETDGLGGFASGTTSGVRTRRYHAWLTVAAPATGARTMMLAGADVLVRTPAGEFRIAPQRYQGDVLDLSQGVRIEQFSGEPWPTWTIALPDGTRLRYELFLMHGSPTLVASWTLLHPAPGVTLTVRPLVGARDYHSLRREHDGALGMDADASPDRVCWRPTSGGPTLVARHTGTYDHAPTWYRGFDYRQERDRGFDHVEDLASPGAIAFDLSRAPASIVFSAEGAAHSRADLPMQPLGAATAARDRERARRAAFATPLDRAADQYIVKRGDGPTIIAGYPWFADWGRDTCIALRGLCLATDRLSEARDILLRWSEHVRDGMLPNRFPDEGEAPEYNSVDAALWFVVCVHELLARARERGVAISRSDEDTLRSSVLTIVASYAGGTRYSIEMDRDGLLKAGQAGVQLTWMDARVGERVITPRIGKPVEVQALWLNALWIASRWEQRWRCVHERGLASFRKRFWNAERGCLHDVVDADHCPGAIDATLRPNQLLAVGGLPQRLVSREQALSIVGVVERELLTPLGPRSLSPESPEYRPRYEGGPAQRDGAYHQGPVWPWLLGPFVEGWLRAHGDTPENRSLARARFVQPMLGHLARAGVGHVSEIADGDAPHTPRGCPFQAWSLGELLRLDRVVLGPLERDGPHAGEVVARPMDRARTAPSRSASSRVSTEASSHTPAPRSLTKQS